MNLKSTVPVKYKIRAHKTCASYPNEMDVLFDLIEHVFHSNKKKKTWKPADLKIKQEDIKNAFPDVGDEKFKDKIKTILVELHKNNNIAFADGYIIVTQEGLSKLYDV